jgi:HEAT repeat protein
MKNPAAVDVLIELLNDEEVAGHALMGLAKLKAHKSRPHIERFLNHAKPWIRTEASKALAKLEN